MKAFIALRFKQLLLTGFILIVISSASHSQINNSIPLIRGEYEMGVKLCYDSITREISGLIALDNADEGAGRVQFSCNLYFTGKPATTGKRNEYTIQCRYTDDSLGETASSGIIRIEKGSVFIQVKEPLACQNLIDLKDGVTFDFIKRQDFKFCRLIRPEKSFFYAQPADTARQRAYMVKTNPVFVLNIKGEWLYIAYYGKKGIRNGWIRKETVRPSIQQ